MLQKLSLLFLNWLTARQEVPSPEFIILIFIHYRGWIRKEDGSPMVLEAVKNDVQLVLKFLRYRHGDQSKRWRFLLDFPCEFTDYENGAELLPSTPPTSDAILEAIRDSSSAGGSGLVYYGGHCENRPDGKSFLNFNRTKNAFYYSTQATDPGRTPRSYLIASDAQRLYGDDLLACLPSLQNPNTKYTFVFDACTSEPLLELGYTYDETGMHNTASLCDEQAQLVAVSAARRGETAGTITILGPIPVAYGFLTYYLLHCLSRRFCFQPSTLTLVRYLNRKCAMTKPETQMRQHISVTSRRPLVGAFKLLPGSSPANFRTLTIGNSIDEDVLEKE